MNYPVSLNVLDPTPNNLTSIGVNCAWQYSSSASYFTLSVIQEGGTYSYGIRNNTTRDDNQSMWQAVNMPDSYVVDIDSGQNCVVASLTYQRNTGYANTDQEWVRYDIQFFSGAGATGTVLGIGGSTGMQHVPANATTTWLPLNVVAPVPVGTRSVKLAVYAGFVGIKVRNVKADMYRYGGRTTAVPLTDPSFEGAVAGGKVSDYWYLNYCTQAGAYGKTGSHSLHTDFESNSKVNFSRSLDLTPYAADIDTYPMSARVTCWVRNEYETPSYYNIQCAGGVVETGTVQSRGVLRAPAASTGWFQRIIEVMLTPGQRVLAIGGGVEWPFDRSPNTESGSPVAAVTDLGKVYFDDISVQLNYLAVPTTIGACTPNWAPVSGVLPGTGQVQVTITGNGFTGATAVRFGGVNATNFTVQDSNTITALVPAAAAAGVANVDVVVGGQTATLTDGFTYKTPVVFTARIRDAAGKVSPASNAITVYR